MSRRLFTKDRLRAGCVAAALLQLAACSERVDAGAPVATAAADPVGAGEVSTERGAAEVSQPTALRAADPADAGSVAPEPAPMLAAPEEVTEVEPKAPTLPQTAAKSQAKRTDTKSGARALDSKEPVAEVSTLAAYVVESNGRVSFLIDAPLEKIKGHWSRVGGQLTVDPEHLEKTRGEVTMDLSGLKTTTFGDAGQDARQTAHALNWMEIGDEVPSEVRARYRTATFHIEQILSAEPNALGEVARALVKVRGSMTLHGVRSDHQVELEVTAEGDPKVPSALRVTSKKPLVLSLKRHDIKPRDLAGRFLAGALEQVGQKISDTVQISLDLRLVRK